MDQTFRERAFRTSLAEVRGVGAVTFWKLLRHFGSAEAVWKAPDTALQELVSLKVVAAIRKKRAACDPVAHIKALGKAGIRIYCFELDAEYPVHLGMIEHPPAILYARGELIQEDRNTVAVVGTRKPTDYGAQVTKTITADLVSYGFTIVSGLARGVDRIAHETALEAGGRTVAVLGCGIDQIYPPEHRDLAERIVGRGAIVSSFAPGEPALRGHFVARNRIVAGMSRGVLVTEGLEKSGSKITASFAREQGRPVFAVPGPITHLMSAAPNSLLKTGAMLVTTGADIAAVFGHSTIKQTKMVQLGGNEARLYQLVREGHQEIDELARELGLPIAEISVLISLLELKDCIRKQGSKLMAK